MAECERTSNGREAHGSGKIGWKGHPGLPKKRTEQRRARHQSARSRKSLRPARIDRGLGSEPLNRENGARPSVDDHGRASPARPRSFFRRRFGSSPPTQRRRRRSEPEHRQGSKWNASLARAQWNSSVQRGMLEFKRWHLFINFALRLCQRRDGSTERSDNRHCSSGAHPRETGTRDAEKSSGTVNAQLSLRSWFIALLCMNCTRSRNERYSCA